MNALTLDQDLLDAATSRLAADLSRKLAKNDRVKRGHGVDEGAARVHERDQVLGNAKVGSGGGLCSDADVVDVSWHQSCERRHGSVECTFHIVRHRKSPHWSSVAVRLGAAGLAGLALLRFKRGDS